MRGGKKIAQFQNIFLRYPLCVNIYEQHFSQIGEEKKNARYAEHVYIEPQIKNDESTRCQVTPGTDNEDEPKKNIPIWRKKNIKKSSCCILLRALSDGPLFIGWLLILDLIL